MSQSCLIRISVRPYVKKFLVRNYSEPFFATDRGFAPGFILNALEKPVKVHPAAIPKRVQIEYGEFIHVSIGASTARKKGQLLSSENVRIFNEVVTDALYEQLYQFVVMLSESGCQIDASIRSFLSMYNFTEDDLSFENAKRQFYKLRKRKSVEKMLDHSKVPAMVATFYEEKVIPADPYQSMGAEMSLLGFGG
ncbi:hypothetical protein [Mucilaginibacter sp. CSA2-8R]|uniref:hypothetical protein n=1 Tax=Mucilaginibacter sp. CSA2-8R TaxID=3141542 RepID=UPI00315C9BC0